MKVSDPGKHNSRFDPAWLGTLGLVGFAGFIPGLEPLRLFFVFSLLGLAVPLFRRKDKADAPARPELPLNRPAQHSGVAAFVTKLVLSQVLALLNPIQLAQMLAQNFGQLIAVIRRRGHLPDAASHVQQARYTPPFRGEWFVFNGGVTQATSHSWDILARRYAYDFVIVDAALMRHRDEGETLTDYFCYGQDVLAPAEGEVVAVRDGVRDAPRPGSGWIDFLVWDFRGNHIVIKHAEHEFSFLAHLIPGSIIVRKSEHVQRGQTIGRCGNSGYSTEPHLHFHVQDHPDFWVAVGVPVKFAGLDEAARFLMRGERISNTQGQ